LTKWLPGGYNNWYSVSVDGAKFQLKFNHGASERYSNFDYAANRAALLLKQQWSNKPLYLALSGGIDSECVANVLLRNQIEFTPVILKIESLNAIETWYAEYWCRKNNIVPVILEYTINDLCNSMIKFFPKLYAFKNYEQTPIMIVFDYVEQQGGHCIYSAGDINLEPGTDQFFCKSLDFISDIVGKGRHPSAFFMYTPELALSYINKFDTSLDEQYNKLNFYGVSPRPKVDYLSSISSHDKFNEVRTKLLQMFKTDIYEFDARHWYGTREQIIQQLQP